MHAIVEKTQDICPIEKKTGHLSYIDIESNVLMKKNPGHNVLLKKKPRTFCPISIES